VVLAVAFVKEVIPLVVRVPVMLVFPEVTVPVTVFPDVTCPLIPRPPVMTRAPVPVVVLAVPLVKVVFPDAVKVPVIVVAPEASVPAVERFPAVTCPATPTPPETTRAPVLVVVLAVAFDRVVIPLAERVPEMVWFPDASVVTVVAAAERVPAVLMFPAVICPTIPTPPAIVKAPVPVVVLAVAFVMDVIPETESVPVRVVFPEESVPDVT